MLHDWSTDVKIALVDVNITVSYGGIQTALTYLAKALHDIGHEVTVFGGEGPVTPDFGGRNIDLRIYPFAHRDTLPNLGSRFGKLAERVSFARHARKDFIAKDFDWAITAKPFDFFWPWILPKTCRTRFAFRSGGTDFFAGDRFLSRRIAGWFANSHFNAWQIKSHYGIYPKVIYNGVDLERFSPAKADPARRAQLGLKNNDILFIYAGRIVGWKGLKTALAALGEPALADLPVKLLIIGNGPDKPSLEKLATAPHMAGRIHFLPPQSHVELAAWYASADVGLFPSVGDEGFSNSIAEAMASGLPVIATAFSGNPETVGNEGTAGLLVPPSDAQALAVAMRELASDAARRGEMGTNARARIERFFTWDKVAHRLLDGILCADLNSRSYSKH